MDSEHAGIQLPQYQCHKKVWALKISAVERDTLSFEDGRYAPIQCEDGMFARYTPKSGDYYVVYDDGYKSISPAKAFEDGYTRL
jgi:hypothetical protein